MSLWVKICGNTSLEDALLATEAGADALGFVFAHSPRRVTVEQVAAITAHLPGAVEKIGVFVDAGLDEILAAVRVAGLTGVQVQSDASPELPALLHEHLGMELRILRVVHFGVEAAQQAAAVAADPHVDAVLVDSRTATAVGGTGVAYDWAIARKTLFLNSNFLNSNFLNSNFLDSNIKDSNFKASNAQVRLIAAGGLNPENVAEAIASLRPWGVDVVSGVEATPGRKDPVKVREFVARVRSVERQLSNRPAEEN